jgi:branched-chain amino acid transport system ATP-binding protein
MLNVENISVSYGRSIALDGVSISVQKGDVAFIVGRNGAGKSTLLKSIAGVTPRQRGKITYEGKELVGKPPEKLARDGLCLIPEGRHIFRSLTVGENLAMGGSTRRDRSQLNADIERVVTMFPILADRYKGIAGNLSGGEQQQLAIARAILQKPRLLMIDEPSLGLAPLVIDQVYEKLRELNKEGLTLVVVEQSTARVLDLATKVYVLRNGKVALEAGAASLSSETIEGAYFGFSGDAS